VLQILNNALLSVGLLRIHYCPGHRQFITVLAKITNTCCGTLESAGVLEKITNKLGTLRFRNAFQGDSNSFLSHDHKTTLQCLQLEMINLQSDPV